MATRSAVGKSNHKKGLEAGREAAQKALDGLAGHAPHLILVFGTSAYDQEALLAGVREITGKATLSGCSAEGIITRDGSDEGRYAVSVLAIHSDQMRFDAFLLEGASQDSGLLGAQLGHLVTETGHRDGKLLMVFPDGLTANCSQLLATLETHLPYPIPVVGGGAGEAMKFERTYQYHQGRAISDGLAAVLVSGNVHVEIGVSHGSEPIGLERTITRTEGPFVMEIDGQPAWNVFKEYVDGEPEDLHASSVAYLSVGERLGDDFIIRSPLGLNKENGALFFPGGFSSGAKVHLTRRNPELIHDSAVQTVKGIVGRHPDQKPALLLQFDCCGRGRLIFGDATNETTIFPMQGVLNSDVPWAGIFCYGEIASRGDKPYYHNYTAVLCALYDQEPARV